MNKQACSRDAQARIQESPEPKDAAKLRLIAGPAPVTAPRYRVRVGNKLFVGNDTRPLLKLAVEARRSRRHPTDHPC